MPFAESAALFRSILCSMTLCIGCFVATGSSGFLLQPSALQAATVQFDVNSTIGCVSQGANIAPPLEDQGERLVLAPMQISALVTSGSAAELAELLYEAVAPERRISIHDYSPQTQLSTDVIGSINVQKTNSDGRRASIGLNGAFESILRADASGGAESSESKSESYKTTPPRELVSAAGTVHRGHGVYFKLKHSPQTSLEGSREFVLTLRVPTDWRGDYLRVNCLARNARGEQLGRSSFLVPIYDRSDPQAKQLAVLLNQQERQLLNIAAAYRGEIDRLRKPTVIHELSLARPEIPANWLVQILAGTAGAKPLAFERQLPQRMQSAINDYRRALHRLTAIPPNTNEIMLTQTNAATVPVTAATAN